MLVYVSVDTLTVWVDADVVVGDEDVKLDAVTGEVGKPLLAPVLSGTKVVETSESVSVLYMVEVGIVPERSSLLRDPEEVEEELEAVTAEPGVLLVAAEDPVPAVLRKLMEE